MNENKQPTHPVSPPGVGFSFVTGKTLYEHIHVQREKMTLHTRVQILQGVAQGMGYLHAKGIVLRKLNTANIFLCPRVKVSAIDFSLPEARHNRLARGEGEGEGEGGGR